MFSSWFWISSRAGISSFSNDTASGDALVQSSRTSASGQLCQTLNHSPLCIKGNVIKVSITKKYLPELLYSLTNWDCFILLFLVSNWLIIFLLYFTLEFLIDKSLFYKFNTLPEYVCVCVTVEFDRYPALLLTSWSFIFEKLIQLMKVLRLWRDNYVISFLQTSLNLQKLSIILLRWCVFGEINGQFALSYFIVWW